ncbi:MAG: hypothetical protein WBP81_33760 [Solirubrobacteraceae bacterium]
MSNVTAELLLKYGFTYDHSQGYNDFTPFYARVGDQWTKIDYTKEAGEWMKPVVRGEEIDLVEIGANWYVDDLPPMMFIKGSPNSHGFVNPRHIEEMWRDQFDWVYANMDYAVFAFTIHPDVSGRPQVLLMLERLIGRLNQHAAVAPAGYQGLVVEGTGGGHTTAGCVDQLEQLAKSMPVVLASRTGAGELLTRTYSFVGSEIDLINRGLIAAGAMTGAHARVLLRLLLAAQASIAEIGRAFEALVAPGSPAELLDGRLIVTA